MFKASSPDLARIDVVALNSTLSLDLRFPRRCKNASVVYFFSNACRIQSKGSIRIYLLRSSVNIVDIKWR